MSDAASVLEFWQNAGPKTWFSKSDAFDASIKQQFGALHKKAAANELSSWENQPASTLALILILDQFSRNLFRNDARAFAQDELCLRITKSALSREFDTKVDPPVKQFYYMPLMHSESILDQRHCVSLFHAASLPDNLKFAILHRDIIERFGRFPHRNSALGRPTSPTELSFLDGGGFSG
jgi:uncharacterized protein (DUF924 family)